MKKRTVNFKSLINKSNAKKEQKQKDYNRGIILGMIMMKKDPEVYEQMDEYRDYISSRIELIQDPEFYKIQTEYGRKIFEEELAKYNSRDLEIEIVEFDKQEILDKNEFKEVIDININIDPAEAEHPEEEIEDNELDKKKEDDLDKVIKPSFTILPDKEEAAINFSKEEAVSESVGEDDLTREDEPEKELDQGITFGIDIDRYPMLKIFKSYAEEVGLKTIFFEDTTDKDLIRVCYTASNMSLIKYEDDIIDSRAKYFPNPVLIINGFGNNILGRPVIPMDVESIKNYLRWKVNPESNVGLTNYVNSGIVDALMVQFNYNDNEAVRLLNNSDSEKLKSTLSEVLQMLESNPLTSSIRWTFLEYKNPGKFKLVPEKMIQNGLVQYGPNQTCGLMVDYSEKRKEKIKILTAA